MKKLLIALAFVAAGLVANAQLFVGGSLSAGFTAGNSEESFTTNNVTETEIDYANRISSFMIAPTVGYMISDVMGFGATIGYSTSVTKSCTDVAKKEFGNKGIYSDFAIAPFFRYVFGDFGNVKLYADAELPIAFGSSKSIYKDKDTTLEEKGPKTFEIGFHVVPSISYEFNDNISINAELGLLSLGWSQTKVSYSGEYDGVTTEGYEKLNEFGFGVNTRVPVSIGFIYTF